MASVVIPTIDRPPSSPYTCLDIEIGSTVWRKLIGSHFVQCIHNQKASWALPCPCRTYSSTSDHDGSRRFSLGVSILQIPIHMIYPSIIHLFLPSSTLTRSLQTHKGQRTRPQSPKRKPHSKLITMPGDENAPPAGNNLPATGSSGPCGEIWSWMMRNHGDESNRWTNM